MTRVDLSTKSPWPLVAGLGLVLAAFCTLAALGLPEDGLFALLTVLGIGGVHAHTTSRLDRQDQALTTITHQTNGVLTGRIEAGARKAIRAELRAVGITTEPDETGTE